MHIKCILIYLYIHINVDLSKINRMLLVKRHFLSMKKEKTILNDCTNTGICSTTIVVV